MDLKILNIIMIDEAHILITNKTSLQNNTPFEGKVNDKNNMARNITMSIQFHIHEYLVRHC
jgi:hypothetical protein